MNEQLRPEVATAELPKPPESEQLSAFETPVALAEEAHRDFDAFAAEQAEAETLVEDNSEAATELVAIAHEAEAAKRTFDVELIDSLIASGDARTLLANESQLDLPLTPKQWKDAADSIPLYRDTIQELFRYQDEELGHGSQVVVNERSRYVRDRVLQEGKIDSFLEFFDEFERIQPLTEEDRSVMIEKYINDAPAFALDIAGKTMETLGQVDPNVEKQIIEKLSERPVDCARLFSQSSPIDLPSAQREQLLDTLAGNNVQFLREAVHGNTSLTPEERKTFIQKTLERQPDVLVGLEAALAPEQQRAIAEHVVAQAMTRGKNDARYNTERIQDLFATRQGEAFTHGVETVFPTLDDEGKHLLFDELTNRFQYNFTENKKVAQSGLAANQDAAIRILGDMTRDEQQAYLPALIEHTLDPDFGNSERAAALIAQLNDPNVRSRYESLVGKFDDREQRQKAFQEQLQQRSEENRDVFAQHLAATYGEEATREVLAKIEGKTFVTVNIPASSIVNILQSGRMMSIWETKRRGGVEDLGGGATLETAPDATYFRARSAVERKMGVRAKGTENDPNPIYGALGYENGNDEKRGSAPEYGDFFFVLKDDVANNRTSCAAGDSFHKIPVETRQFSMKDAAIARAKVELAQAARAKDEAPPDPEWDYVDVQILGGVSLPDIQSINIPADKAEDPANQRVLAQIREKFPDVTITILPV